MNLGSWLPQVLALLPSVGVASISLFANRKKRVMSELDTLLDLRERCSEEDVASRNLDNAIESVSKRLNDTMQRRVDGSSLAVVVILAVILFCISYPTWLWVVGTGAWYAWLTALSLTIVSVTLLAAAVTTVFKTDAEIEESEKKRAAKKLARKQSSIAGT